MLISYGKGSSKKHKPSCKGCIECDDEPVLGKGGKMAVEPNSHSYAKTRWQCIGNLWATYTMFYLQKI